MTYVGVDWSDSFHIVYVTDETGDSLAAFKIEHTPEGVESLFLKVKEHAKDPASVLFALETPKGLLSSAILDAGFTLYPINPKAVDRYRDRYKVSGKKDDYFDAMVLANILRTDRQNHRALVPDSLLTRELRAYTEGYQALVKTQTRLTNQITSCLKNYYPVVLGIFGKIDQSITLNFLSKFPTPDSFHRGSKAKFENILKKNRYPGAKEKMLEIYALSKKPQFEIEEPIARANSLLLLSLVRQMKETLSSLKEFELKIAELLEQHPDKEVFSSLPGSGNITTAKLISNFGDNRERYGKVSCVQADAGTCPVTIGSGKSLRVSFRYSCRKPFRSMMTQFAFSSLQKSEWAKQRYDKYRQNNSKDHNLALRCLANAWLEIIFPMWRDRKPYDVEKHLIGVFKEQGIFSKDVKAPVFVSKPMIARNYRGSPPQVNLIGLT